MFGRAHPPVAHQATAEVRRTRPSQLSSFRSWWIGRLSGLLALSFAGALVGCAADADGDVLVEPVSSSSSAIFGGDRDDDDGGGVVALRVGTGGTFELCSGALIAPNVVLTARHCVTKNLTTSVSCDENGRSANGKHVTAEEDPRAVGVFVGAAPSFAQKPDAFATSIVSMGGDYLCDRDIALLVLDQPITGARPMPVRLGAPVGKGETIRSVGYGQNDKSQPLGTRFRKDGVPVLAMGKAVSASRTPLGPHEFEVGRSICQGDSGGPAISEETGAVVGVVSRGGSCDEDFGHIYTTTRGFEALFEQAFALAGGAPIPEPYLPSGARVRSSGSSGPDIESPPRAAGCSVTQPHTQTGRETVLGTTCAAFFAAALVRRKRRA